MLLGNRLITAGDTRRYEVNYREFLQQGDTIASFTVTDNGATSQVGSTALDVGNTQLFIFVKGGTVGEMFTVSVQIVTVYGEIVNDTITFTVVAP